MTFDEVKKHLDKLLLVRALWWFVDTSDSLDQSARMSTYCYLRDRVRAHEGLSL